jgi:subtilisin family serine protease
MVRQKAFIPFKAVKNIIDEASKPVVYSGVDYGIPSKWLGKNVEIAIIDTGCPVHKDLKNNLSDKVNFSDRAKTFFDNHGHATMVAGLIAANNKEGLVGLAPGSNLHSCKVSNNGGECDFNAIVAAILWSIVKKVDIILLSLGTNVDYKVLYNAIKKAHDADICIIAAGNNGKKTPLYPASYNEVLSFEAKPKGRDVKAEGNGSKSVFISMPQSGLFTTFGKKEYTRVYGSSMAASIGAGLAALIIERKSQDSFQVVKPRDVYSAIRGLKT